METSQEHTRTLSVYVTLLACSQQYYADIAMKSKSYVGTSLEQYAVPAMLFWNRY
jgi:hypothetical protein